MRRIPLIALMFALVLFARPFRGWSGEESATKPARAARLTLRDGSSELVRLNGVGCDKSLCSRVAINGGIQGRIQLDRLDAIHEVCNGRAQFVFRGSMRDEFLAVAGAAHWPCASFGAVGLPGWARRL